MRSIFWMLALVFTAYSCSSNTASGDLPEKTNLNPKEFQQLIEQAKNTQLIDVRTPEEFEDGHIENATNINWNDPSFFDNVEKLSKTEPVLVYCLSGNRSASAAYELRKMGFEHVYELTGGMLHWRGENMPEISANKKKSLSMDDYKAMIQSDKLILVDFYADWCSPCKKMEPYLMKIAEDSKEVMELVRINTDEHPQLAASLQVTGLPTLKLYKNGKEVWNQLGLVDENTIREQLKTNK
jgi:thioredoxin 1